MNGTTFWASGSWRPFLRGVLCMLHVAAVAANGQQSEAGTPLIQNGDFSTVAESGSLPAGWAARIPEAVSRENKGGRPEAHIVTLQSADADEMPLIMQRDLPLIPGERYTGVYDVFASADTSYRVYVEWWKTDGEYGGAANTGWRPGAGRWAREYFSFRLPEDAKPPYIVLQLKAPGECSFERVALHRREAPKSPPEGFVFKESFEEGTSRWELPYGADDVRGDAADGEVFLSLSSDDEGHDPSAYIRDIPTLPGRMYRLTYRVRSGGGSKEVTGFQHFRVVCSWERLVADGRDYGTVSQREGEGWQDCFGSWQRRTLDFTAPSKPTAGMVLQCQVRGPGEVHIDDIALIEREDADREAPVELVITRPSYRATWYPGETPAAIQGFVWTTDPEVSRVRVGLSSADEASELVMSPVEDGGLRADFELDAPVGTVVVEALDRDGKRLGTRRCEVRHARPTTPGEAKTLIRPDGIPLIGSGEPVFPVGLWRPPGNERQVAELAEAGFNVVRCTADEELLEMLATYGLMAMVNVPSAPPPDPDAATTWEAQVKERYEPINRHTNILGYYLCDEPLWNGRPHGPLVQAYEFYRRWQPYLPVWINMAPRGTVLDLARYNRACDISGVDIYPVPEGGSHSEMANKTLSCVGDYTVKMHRTVAGRKPVWMTLQGFAWQDLRESGAPDAVYPDAHQSRFMAYDAVIHGAQGIMYWGTHTIADPDFWGVLFDTARDLHAASGVLVGETVADSPVEASSEDVALLHKRCSAADGRVLEVVIAVNESAEDVQAEIRLPFASASVAAFDGPLVASRTRRLSLRNGRITDRFGGYEVRLYALSETAFPPPCRSRVTGTAIDEPDALSFEEAARIRRDSDPYTGAASWIWYPGTSDTAFASCVLRRVIHLKDAPTEAVLMATADDELVLRINGEVVVEDNGWSRMRRHDVSTLLRKGPNVIAVQAADAGVPPAGFLADLGLRFADGTDERVVSDAAWRTAKAPAPGWQETAFDDAAWPAAEVLAPYGQGPWRDRLQVVP